MPRRVLNPSFSQWYSFMRVEFSNPVTLNIDVGWGEVAGTPVTTALGESESLP